MRSALVGALFVLQSFHVAFLLLHDWVPLGRLNDTRAVRAENPGGKLAITTLVSVAPFGFLLYGSAQHLHGVLPGGLTTWLAVAYGLLFAGELRAWWIPYAVDTSQARSTRYQAMFGETYSFLPARHGVTPNTLHVVLHFCTLATLVALGMAVHTGAARL